MLNELALPTMIAAPAQAVPATAPPALAGLAMAPPGDAQAFKDLLQTLQASLEAAAQAEPAAEAEPRSSPDPWPASQEPWGAGGIDSAVLAALAMLATPASAPGPVLEVTPPPETEAAGGIAPLGGAPSTGPTGPLALWDWSAPVTLPAGPPPITGAGGPASQPVVLDEALAAGPEIEPGGAPVASPQQPPAATPALLPEEAPEMLAGQPPARPAVAPAEAEVAQPGQPAAVSVTLPHGQPEPAQAQPPLDGRLEPAQVQTPLAARPNAQASEIAQAGAAVRGEAQPQAAPSADPLQSFNLEAGVRAEMVAQAQGRPAIQGRGVWKSAEGESPPDTPAAATVPRPHAALHLGEPARLAEAPNTGPAADTPPFVAQIGQTIERTHRSGQTSLRLQLYPESLGRVDLRLTAGEDGVRVSLAVDLAATGSLLERHLEGLRRSLTDSGLQVASLSVEPGGGQTFDASAGMGGRPFDADWQAPARPPAPWAQAAQPAPAENPAVAAPGLSGAGSTIDYRI